MIQIESKKAVDNIEEIGKVEGIGDSPVGPMLAFL